MASGAATAGDGPREKKGRKRPARDSKEGGGHIGWADNVDRLLDASPALVTALRAAFIRYQDPRSVTIPPTSLLPALQLFFQRGMEEMNHTAGKIFYRPVTKDDLDALAEEDPSLGIDQPTDIEDFGAIAKKVGRRILVERGKRLGLFVIGGIVVVHAVKGIAKRLPIVGPAADIFLSLVPTILVGPAAGVAGALYTTGA
ncbi:hypothetical protein GOP47_0009698 [Adiantum capillus-veneris]|uniref:Uncharacterized protein n=1 Tax=Adiantum capillus-veneris TaxID=13818 RepID=A0A9D4ZIY6_ADICA|nr:hypothetical protein GOP47_0009698 [Adiantum capillus-veneris]